MIVVKRNSKPVSTTIIKASSFEGNATQPNCRKLSGSSKTQDKTPALNGVSRPVPTLTTQELKGASLPIRETGHSPSGPQNLSEQKI